jgi:hypothetical protein
MAVIALPRTQQEQLVRLAINKLHFTLLLMEEVDFSIVFRDIHGEIYNFYIFIICLNGNNYNNIFLYYIYEQELYIFPFPVYIFILQDMNKCGGYL